MSLLQSQFFCPQRGDMGGFSKGELPFRVKRRETGAVVGLITQILPPGTSEEDRNMERNASNMRYNSKINWMQRERKMPSMQRQ